MSRNYTLKPENPWLFDESDVIIDPAYSFNSIGIYVLLREYVDYTRYSNRRREFIPGNFSLIPASQFFFISNHLHKSKPKEIKPFLFCAKNNSPLRI